MLSEDKVKKLHNELNQVLKGAEEKNKKIKSITSRTSGGIKRQSKGENVEKIYSKIIEFCIKETKSKFKLYLKYGNLPKEIKDNHPQLKVTEKYSKYDEKIVKKLPKHSRGYVDKYDGYLIINNNVKMLLEFKSYTENAMLKRVLLDAVIAKKTFGEKIKFCLCQLETSFATNNKKNNIYWNPGYNTLSIYSFFDEHIFDPKINIHTLMKGGRLVNQDISSKEFFKEIDYDKFKKVINFFVNFFNNENKQVKV